VDKPGPFFLRGGWGRVTKVRVKPDEPFEKALRRFKKKCNKEGIMQRIKEIKHYEKPSEKRRRKLAKAIARNVANMSES
jgi:small subunit ribosomal protein S21